MPTKSDILISIVDDDEDVVAALANLMKARGYATDAFYSPDDFWNSQKVSASSCLIADVHMPGMTGVDLYRKLVASGHDVPTILITGYHDDGELKAKALADGVICYLTKPFDESVLFQCIESALKRTRRGKGSLQEKWH